MFLYHEDGQLTDSTTELAVALKNEALTENPDVTQSLTFVDFIVSSGYMKDSIQSRGIGAQSSDVTGTYSNQEHFPPYLAASIPFDYFRNRSATSTTNSFKATKSEGEHSIVKFIIGNGFCPAKIPTACQNGKLRENAEYWYISSF